jgi:hypothetical protein
MFWRFKEEKDEKDKSGLTFDEALRKHARWCLETLRNNTPDEEAMKYIDDHCSTWVVCPAKFKQYFAGDAAFNAYSEIKICFAKFKQFYTPEELVWLNDYINSR